MYKKETKKNEIGEKNHMDIDRIRDIVRFIADSSYEGYYTLERHTNSLYRFGFGIVKSGDVPIMFEGKTANEAMYRAIDFELTKELKLTSREKLTKLAEDRLATIQNEQQKRMELAKKLVAKDNSEYKKLIMERDELKQERASISIIVSRITDKWKDDVVMHSFEKNIASASWKKRPSVFIAFLMETIEKLVHEMTSYVTPPLELEEIERKKHLLKEGAIATVNNIRILEPIWNDMRDSIMDGKWHVFSEADEIIMRHGYRKLTLESIQQKRGAYLRFAKDEKYHLARGNTDYLYKWKPIKGVNKFRFIIVGEEAKPEKTEKILVMVKKDVSILESLWNDMQDSIMDGEWHAYSEANEIIMRHGYRHLSMGRILQIRNGYFKFARDEEYHTVRGENDYLFEWKRKDGVNKFRFTTAGEEVKPEKMIENRLELGRMIDCVIDHSIYENPRDEFIKLFCDGKWYSSSEHIEMFKKYDNYNKYKQSSFVTLRSAYVLHVRKFYHKIKKREGRKYKFKFEKKRVEADAIKLQNDVKCARCGQAIHCGEKSYQIGDLFYHPECYEVMDRML